MPVPCCVVLCTALPLYNMLWPVLLVTQLSSRIVVGLQAKATHTSSVLVLVLACSCSLVQLSCFALCLVAGHSACRCWLPPSRKQSTTYLSLLVGDHRHAVVLKLCQAMCIQSLQSRVCHALLADPLCYFPSRDYKQSTACARAVAASSLLHFFPQYDSPICCYGGMML